jgi:hypothetical protein
VKVDGDLIFQQLAGERLLELPERRQTQPNAAPALAALDEPDPLVEAGLAPRVDGWCENRPTHLLSDEDGID